MSVYVCVSVCLCVTVTTISEATHSIFNQVLNQKPNESHKDTESYICTPTQNRDTLVGSKRVK